MDARVPLADYFWIAGVDDAQLLEAFRPKRWSYEESGAAADTLKHGADIVTAETIEEDDGDSGAASTPLSPVSSTTRRSSTAHRLSQISSLTRTSIVGSDGGAYRRSSSSIRTGRSNRSSRTILAKPPRDTTTPSPLLISDQDFEKAMDKFTNDRESFFLDLNFSLDPRQKARRERPRPKTQRIVVADDGAAAAAAAATSPNSMPGRAMGSMRRHLSFKDGTNFKRQSTMTSAARRSSTRRISTYNAVVPRPEALHTSAHEHPLRRKLEPVLLDKYPRPGTPDTAGRLAFPDYLPMFAFPNDISIVSSDARPRSHWHEFSMTAADNSKIPAVCLIVYVPLKRQTAYELERRCEEWRKANMSDVERELAASLAERLAAERAKLSRLLLKLPEAAQGTEARDELEDEISSVEERIAVMADMLRPLRHGAASRIEGLTDGDTGLWIPRAYGLIGRDSCLLGFWRQWLRAVSVPMHDGSILRVPASSPKVGVWQPLERYVHCLCALTPSPASSKVQVDLAVRDLHLYAKKEAANELPGSRTTDLYPLFRTLTIPNIILLMEHVLAESRIILLSSHTSMLQLVSKALVELIWPLKWCGVYIPVLPARLIQALEAPCPYICGVERSYGSYDLPATDFVLVDLDKNELESTEPPPPPLPKQIRRKLQSLLHLASPLHHSFGVAPGPPSYAVEAFPHNAFSVDTESVFSAIARASNLSGLVSLSSSMFGPPARTSEICRPPTLNAFQPPGATRGKSIERPATASTSKNSSSRPDSSNHSPARTGPPLQQQQQQQQPPPAPPFTPVSRKDSGFALQTSLREKRSGHFDSLTKQRNGSISGMPAAAMRRKGSLPLVRHVSSPSTVSLSGDVPWSSNYAPSMYAQSTLAASTILPTMVVQPALNTANVTWVEGHCLEWSGSNGNGNSSGDLTCHLCSDKLIDGGFHRCSGCGLVIHGRCAAEISIVCSAAFYPDQVRAAFARCFASLFYTYKKFMLPAQKPTKLGRQQQQQQKQHARKDGQAERLFRFDTAAFQRSLPHDSADYIEMLSQTQAFNEFIAERESSTAFDSVQIQLFDGIIGAKRNRAGRFRQDMRSLASGRLMTSFGRATSGSGLAAADRPRGDRSGGADVLKDTSTQLWRVVSAPCNNERFDVETASTARGRDYYAIISRVPGRLEDEFFQLAGPVSSTAPQIPQLPRINGRQPVGLGLLSGGGGGGDSDELQLLHNRRRSANKLDPAHDPRVKVDPRANKENNDPRANLRERLNGLRMNSPNPNALQ